MHDKLKPCPFCGSQIKHVESWAKSFNPPRLWHEWHHDDDNLECPVRRSIGKIVCNATDDVITQANVVRRWNARSVTIVLPEQKKTL